MAQLFIYCFLSECIYTTVSPKFSSKTGLDFKTISDRESSRIIVLLKVVRSKQLWAEEGSFHADDDVQAAGIHYIWSVARESGNVRRYN